MMKTRKATEVHRKAKRSKRMKGMIPFHLYSSFDELITDIDTKLVGEMENSSKPNWNIGAKDILPHIMWKYTSGDVDASKDWQEKGKYESSILYLSLCNKDVIKKHVGFPITTGSLHPWLEVKESSIKGAGMGLFAARRFEPGDIITVYFAPKKSERSPKFTKYALKRNRHYFSVKEGCPLFLGAHFMNDATYKCEEKDRERLKKENNAILEGYTVKPRYRIMPGCKIKLSYDGK